MDAMIDENENFDTCESGPVLDISELEFVKDSFLGKGQYGSTYKAKMGDTMVAVKEPFKNELHPTEIDMLKNVRHKNIVRYIDCKFIKKKFCVVMELADNGNLFTILHGEDQSRVPVTPERKDQWINEVACGLLYLHEGLDNPILHGDVKSPNVLIFQAPYYIAKLSDFGLSEEMLEGTYTMKGEGSYTAPWAAPEAVRSKRTTKSDVWSYGALVWEILMEKIPHHTFTDQLAILFAVGHGKSPYDPETDDIPDKYRHLLDNCFSKNHNERWKFKRICRYLEDLQAEDVPNIEDNEAKPVVSEMEKCGFPNDKSKQELYLLAFNRFGAKLEDAELLRKVKYLFKDKIPLGVRDRIKDGYELLETLEKYGYLSAESTDFVSKRLSFLPGDEDKQLSKMFYEDCSIDTYSSNGNDDFDEVMMAPDPGEVGTKVANYSRQPCVRMSSEMYGEPIEREFIREKEGRLGRQEGECSSANLPIGIEDGRTSFDTPMDDFAGQIDKMVHHSSDMGHLFKEVSACVSKDYYWSLGRHLFGAKNYTDKLKAIEDKFTDQRLRTHEMLELWEDTCEASCEKLVTALKAAKLERTASMIEKYMPCPQ